MNRGKSICNQLKEVRRRIAAENGIALETPPCTYSGPCRGTCPQCEAEVRFLERELTQRLRLGRVATVAGLALGLAVGTSAQAQVSPTPADNSPQDDDTAAHRCVAEATGKLKGIVTDLKTGEPLPFVNVMLWRDGKRVAAGGTDLNGCFLLNPVPIGEYTLTVVAFGYQGFEHKVYVRQGGITRFDLSLTASAADSAGQTKSSGVPVIEIGTSESIAGLISDEVRPVGSYGTPKEAMGEIPVTLPGTPASCAGSPPPLPPAHPMRPAQLVGSIGAPEHRGSTVRAERRGPLLIVVEPEEPEL